MGIGRLLAVGAVIVCAFAGVAVVDEVRDATSVDAADTADVASVETFPTTIKGRPARIQLTYEDAGRSGTWRFVHAGGTRFSGGGKLRAIQNKPQGPVLVTPPPRFRLTGSFKRPGGGGGKVDARLAHSVRLKDCCIPGWASVAGRPFDHRKKLTALEPVRLVAQD